MNREIENLNSKFNQSVIERGRERVKGRKMCLPFGWRGGGGWGGEGGGGGTFILFLAIVVVRKSKMYW